MPINIIPNTSLCMIHTVCSGIVSFQQVQDYLQTTWLDSELYGYNELFDFSNSDFSHISHSELISLAQCEAKLYMLDDSARVAFLNHTADHERVSAFFITAKSIIPGPSRELKSFTNKDQAMNWLTLDNSNL